MYDHLLNELIHFWLKTPNATFDDTLEYALGTRMIEIPSGAFVDYIKEEHKTFSERTFATKDWIDKLPTDNVPLGSNPFMEDTCQDN